MKHCSVEDLILHYYDERSRWMTPAWHRRRRRAIERHVDSCAGCAALYESLAGTLQMLEAADAPERGDQYGLEIWQRIRSRLPEGGTSWGGAWLRRDRLALAGGVAMLAFAAFTAGRLWSNAARTPPAASTAASRPADFEMMDGRQGILLTSVADHLDRSERILTDIMNAPDGGDISTEQRWAEDLVFASRLYRQDAAAAGEQSVAGVLEELERNLIEIVHRPSKATAADLDDVRQRIDAAALLFKVRVMSDELRQRESPNRPRPRAVTLHTG